MLRKRAFDALRTDVLAVDAAEPLETVAEATTENFFRLFSRARRSVAADR